MCMICSEAKSMDVDDALKYIAWKSVGTTLPKCVDKLIGELVNEPEPESNKQIERDWVKANER